MGGAGTISILSDQLTAYQLAKSEEEQTALCVLVKTKAPRIEWHLAARSGDDLAEFLAKTDIVAHDISAGRFYKRPGKVLVVRLPAGVPEGRVEGRGDIGPDIV